MTGVIALLALLAPQQPAAPWDSVGRILGTSGTITGGYHRYAWPRRDLTLRVGDVTVAPTLALGAWAGFAGEGDDVMMMGDLVLTSGELQPVLGELARQHITVTAIHNHLAGEEPRITYVHIFAHGAPLDLAARLDRAIARTATPRPVAAAAPQPVTIDTALVFRTLGLPGRAQGAVAQISTVLVPGRVTMHGLDVPPSLGYGTPINIQSLGAGRAVATGDFAVLASGVAPVLDALATHGITATAVHSHLVDEQPAIRYIHFWADGSLGAVLTGLRAALDAAQLTTAWRGYKLDTLPAGWQVVDGALTRVAAGGDIVTRKKYRDFELTLEWKVAPGGNSGIFYRASEDDDAIYWTAPEMQVLDDARHPDGRSRLTSAGSDYGLYPAPPGVVKPAGEWNSVRIVVRGNHVEHWLNGVKVVDYELQSPDWEAKVRASKFAPHPRYGRNAEGYIGLQDHGDWVAYRNITIRELP